MLLSEILCPPLPKLLSYGEYDPTDCAEQKSAHGSTCTLVCPTGFEVKGPQTKTCNGKRTGVWSNRSKTPKCVGIKFKTYKLLNIFIIFFVVIDIEAPTIICPADFTIPMFEENNYALLKIVPPPNVSGNNTAQIY